MTRIATLAALALTAFASSAAAAPSTTTARVIEITPAANGAASVSLEIGGTLVEAKVGDGEIALERGQVAQVQIVRTHQRQWVVNAVKTQLVARN